MKKLIISLAVAIGLGSVAQAQNLTFSATVATNTMSSLVTGPFKVIQLVVTSTGNASGYLVDSYTNSTVYTNAAYTNIVSYVTNMPAIYTNYFGVLSTNADYLGNRNVLVDVTNSVAASTNNLPYVAVSCTTTPTVVNNMNTVYSRGVWFTNTSATGNSVTVTVTGIRQ